jgi:hypothetical protein
VLFYLAGLTCTEETFMTKAGAQRVAAEEGLILVAPDTSPRGAGVPGETDSWDFGAGAGFYVDATRNPGRATTACTATSSNCASWCWPIPADRRACGIFGHSMGGHGALVLALRNPDLFRSVSAFAPIAAPSRCPWGEKAFGGYLGPDRAAWRAYDATELMTCAGALPARASWSTRAWPTSSWPSSCIRTPSRTPAAPPASRSNCAAMPATTTAITSSRPSSKTTCASTAASSADATPASGSATARGGSGGCTLSALACKASPGPRARFVAPLKMPWRAL